MAINDSEYTRVSSVANSVTALNLLQNTTANSYSQALQMGVNFDGDSAFVYNLSILNATVIDILKRLEALEDKREH